jgi:hypothetical protein
MDHETKAAKLLELRTKTDRQLIALIGRLLDRGLSADAERLLPALRGSDRLHLELKLNRVKELSSCKSVYAA